MSERPRARAPASAASRRPACDCLRSPELSRSLSARSTNSSRAVTAVGELSPNAGRDEVASGLQRKPSSRKYDQLRPPGASRARAEDRLGLPSSRNSRSNPRFAVGEPYWASKPGAHSGAPGHRARADPKEYQPSWGSLGLGGAASPSGASGLRSRAPDGFPAKSLRQAGLDAAAQAQPSSPMQRKHCCT